MAVLQDSLRNSSSWMSYGAHDIADGYSDEELPVWPAAWPNVQLCFILAHSKRIRAYYFFRNRLSTPKYLFFNFPIILAFVYVALKLWFLKWGVIEIANKSFVYTTQLILTYSHPPVVSTFSSDRIAYATVLWTLFMVNLVFQAFYTTQIAVPHYAPISILDHRPALDVGLQSLIDTYEVGVGQQCIDEVKKGAFDVRVCRIEVSAAVLLIRKYPEVVIIPDSEKEIEKFPKWTESEMYFHEFGFANYWMNKQNGNSYKNLITTTTNRGISVEDIDVLLMEIAYGYFASMLLFLIELVYFRFRRGH